MKISSYSLNNSRNFNEIFRRDVPYDIKSHKKAGFHPLFRRCIFQKTTAFLRLRHLVYQRYGNQTTEIFSKT